MLRGINPKEAKLLDVAANAHVRYVNAFLIIARFRLGGSAFPPTIYYKIYIHKGLVDIGNFAPRDYTASKQAPPIKLHSSGYDIGM